MFCRHCNDEGDGKARRGEEGDDRASSRPPFVNESAPPPSRRRECDAEKVPQGMGHHHHYHQHDHQHHLSRPSCSWHGQAAPLSAVVEDGLDILVGSDRTGKGPSERARRDQWGGGSGEESEGPSRMGVGQVNHIQRPSIFIPSSSPVGRGMMRGKGVYWQTNGASA